ncbi:hypothetical protein LCGC14_3024090 [marine sediment metagenome]|uniref:Uncharacterized protein n=1 Tax=marine sediment metagenome TaxID=412755 RepID=A0A0F8WUV3_9ZZZZ
MNNSMDAYLNEAILYGGIPLRRGDVYLVCLEDTGSRWAADFCAFGPNYPRTEQEPWTRTQFREALAYKDYVRVITRGGV